MIFGRCVYFLFVLLDNGKKVIHIANILLTYNFDSQTTPKTFHSLKMTHDSLIILIKCLLSIYPNQDSKFDAGMFGKER